jgi:hypothetical protein
MPRSATRAIATTAPLRAPKRVIKKKLPRDCALIAKWLKDESGYDERTWPILKANLQRNRTSGRKLFND